MGDLALMDYTLAKRIIVSALLTVAIYGIALPMWMSARGAYATGVAATASGVGFPALGLDGGVRARRGRWITLTYTLPDARTSKWASVNQRFLDFSDIPLAVAASLGLMFLRWRRRLVVALASSALVWLCHLCLVLFCAVSLSKTLQRTDLGLQEMDGLVQDIVWRGTGYGNVSTAVVFGVVGVLTAVMSRRGTRNSSVLSPPSG